jgi:hypothetical protein
MCGLPGSYKGFRLLRIIILTVFIFNFARPGGYAFADGAALNALSFDGVNDYVFIGETATVMGGDAWKDMMTVSLWVKPVGSGFCLVNDPAQCDSIIGDRPRWWGLSHGVVNGLDRLWVWNYDGNYDKIGIPYTAGQWVHIAWVHSGGLLSVYKNGILMATVPSGTTQQPTTGAFPKLQLGAVINNSTRNWSFQGEMEEVSFFNTALTQNEIRDSIFSGFTGSESGLRAYYKMSNGSGTVLTDDSGNGFDGTLLDGGGIVDPNGSYPLWITSGAFDKPLAYDLTGTTNEDTPAPIILSGLGAPTATLTYTYSDPPHGSLSGTAPNLTYSPDLNYFGADSFTYQVWDGVNGSVLATVSLTINSVNDIPVANGQTWNTDEDIASPLILSGSDVDGDVITYSLVSGPTNGVLSGTIPNYIYTPNLNYYGSDSFTFKVNDTHSDSATATVAITINSVNDAPEVDNLIKNTLINTPVNITLQGTDVENDPLTFSIVDPPIHGVLSGVIPALTYTPTGSYVGSDSFTYKANDTYIDSNIATVNINISTGNLAPIANNQSVSTNEDISKNITLTGSDPENAAITFTILDQPLHGILSGSVPDVVYTPNNNYNGDDHFTFKVNDGYLDSSIATVSITIFAINDQPLAIGQDIETNADTAVGITLTGSDIDNNPLTFSIVTIPEHGILTGTAPDLIFTPTSGYIGPDSFTFKVNDGLVDSAPALVNITVLSGNLPPIANAQEVETNEDVPLGITLTGSDAEGADLTYSFLYPPTHGNFGGSSAPNLTYTPFSNYFGTDYFIFRVYDGVNWSEPATVSITIHPINDLPRGTNQILETNKNNALDILISGTDVDGDILSYSISTDPVNGRLTGTPPNMVYTPDENYIGLDTFRFMVFDGTSWSASSALVTINVVAFNNIPTAFPDEYSVLRDQSLIINSPGVMINDLDLDGDSLLAYVVDDVQHGSLSLNTDGSLIYVANGNYVGDDQFSYHVFDGTVNSLDVSVTIHVIEGYRNYLPMIAK